MNSNVIQAVARLSVHVRISDGVWLAPMPSGSLYLTESTPYARVTATRGRRTCSCQFAEELPRLGRDGFNRWPWAKYPLRRRNINSIDGRWPRMFTVRQCRPRTGQPRLPKGCEHGRVQSCLVPGYCPAIRFIIFIIDIKWLEAMRPL